ncbi:FERM central domain-containing protein [Ditylenchus destructor]|nr:FERM central domain-containing protein [Ditylenchus destructor]
MVDYYGSRPPARFHRSENGRESSVASKRRLSFSNCDLDDSSQLDVMYNQCRDAVISGFHPVPRLTAIKLATIQCFIEHGPYQPGVEDFISAQLLLPKEYHKAKELEKNIIQDYQDLFFENITAARKKYCAICQSSATYGTTFFLVKERESPTERRLTRRLFGINKDCVMSVDRKSKIVLKSWPLEQIRRWAASPTTFNIDFGDYAEGYYSVQTFEGEKMKKILGNYIDIILKKSQIVDHTGIEGDEGGIMLEDQVAGARALPFVVESGQVVWRQRSASEFSRPTEFRQHPEFATMQPEKIHRPVPIVTSGGFPDEQQIMQQYQTTQIPGSHEIHIAQGNRQNGTIGAVITTSEVAFSGGQQQSFTYSSALSSAVEKVIQLSEQNRKFVSQPLETIQLPPNVGRIEQEQIVEVGKQSVRERLGFLVATVAQIIEWTDVTIPTTDEHITEAVLSTCGPLSDLVVCVRELCSILPDKQLSSELIQRTHKFCDVFALFLEKLGSSSKRSVSLSAASLVGETSCGLVNAMESQKSGESRAFYDALSERIQNVATSTANLVLQSKAIPAACEDYNAREKFVQAATRVALSTSELIALARVLAIIISHPACQERIVESVQKVAFAVEDMLHTANACKTTSAEQQKAYDQLVSSAHFTNNALHQLLKHVQS